MSDRIDAAKEREAVDALIEDLLDAQQDINLRANQHMDQSLCDASALIDKTEVTLRRLLDALDAKDAEIAKLRAALKPFAEQAARCGKDFTDYYSPSWAIYFTMGDFRRALAAFNSEGKP